MANNFSSVYRRALRLNQQMKNGETRAIPGSRLNGGRAVVFRARNGQMNLIGANYSNDTIARYFKDGSKHSISPDAIKHTYSTASKKVFSGGAQYKRGSTGSRGG